MTSLSKTILKTFLGAALLLLGATLDVAIAGEATKGIGAMADTVGSNFDEMAKVVTGFFYLAGLSLGGFAFFKLKAHKDNPQQTPLSTPAMLFMVAVGLAAIPEFMGTGLGTFFDDASTTNTIKGTTVIKGSGTSSF